MLGVHFGQLLLGLDPTDQPRLRLVRSTTRVK